MEFPLSLPDFLKIKGSTDTTMHMELPKNEFDNARFTQSIPLTVILLLMSDYQILKEMYGQGFVDQLEKELKNILVETTTANTGMHVEVFKVAPGEMALFIPHTAPSADIAYEYKLKSQNGLKQTMFRHTGLGIDLGMGYADVDSFEDSPQKKDFVLP